MYKKITGTSIKGKKVTAFSIMTILLLCWVPTSTFAQNDVETLLGDLTNYLMVIGDGRTEARWEGASRGFVGDVAVNGTVATEVTAGTVPYGGTVYTNDNTLDQWQGIIDDNSGQAFVSFNETALITDLTNKLNSAFTDINALTVTSGYAGVSSTFLDGLNTQNNISETFVINVTSGFSVSSTINITGDASDVFILRWDTDQNFSDGYEGIVRFSSGGAIVPLGDLTAGNFIHVAGQLESSGGGSTPSSPYPQGPRYYDGQGDLITGGQDFNGGGFFTGYWLTTGAPDNPADGNWDVRYGDQGNFSNGIFVGGWYTINTKFSMTSGTNGVYVTPPTTTNLTQGPCWRTLASPVEQSYADFFATFSTGGTNHGGLWTQGVTGARYPSGGNPNVYTMNSDGSNWVAVSDLTQTLQAGTGVLISIFENDVHGDPSTGGFPKETTISASSAPFNFNLGTRTGTTASGSGFSLLGNPFKTGLNFAEFHNDASGIVEAAWVYDINNDNRNSPGWRSTNGTGIGDIAGGIIAAGQGFVVQNTSGTPSVDFQNDAKASGTGTFYGKRAGKPDHLRIEVQGEGVYNSAWVQLSNQGTTTERTRGDVVQFYPFESEYAVLSSLKQGEMMDIGHFPYPDEEITIPLAIETTSTKPMTLRLTDMQLGLASSLYLVDTITGKSTELTEGAEYTFTPDGSPAKAVSGCLRTPTGFIRPASVNKEAAPRFLITTDANINKGESDLPTEFGLRQNYPNPFNPTTQITYEIPQNSDVRLEVFDMIGRQVATLVNESVSAGTHTVNFNASNLSSGVYIYKLNAGSTVLTKKLTLIK